jgi:hypothetical protein
LIPLCSGLPGEALRSLVEAAGVEPSTHHIFFNLFKWSDLRSTTSPQSERKKKRPMLWALFVLQGR